MPVVYAYSGDPVAAGLAESLARPNAEHDRARPTSAAELNGKRLELLRELVPSVRRVALLANPAYPGEAGERANSEAAAGRVGLDVRHVAARTSDELAAAFTRMASDGTQAISLFADSFTVQNRDRIVAFALSEQIPLVSSWPVFAEAGALCTYGPRLADSYRRLAYYADRVLRGTGRPICRSSSRRRSRRSSTSRPRMRSGSRCPGGAGARRRDPLTGATEEERRRGGGEREQRADDRRAMEAGDERRPVASPASTKPSSAVASRPADARDRVVDARRRADVRRVDGAHHRRRERRDAEREAAGDDRERRQQLARVVAAGRPRRAGRARSRRRR